jgi:hypothetical protein
MYQDNEILFPNYVIPMLRDMRGEEWRQLIDRIVELPEDDPDVIAFVLMMVRFNGCMECETDSYRAMRGCAMCATQTLHRYHGSDRELLKMYAKAQADVQAWLAGEQVQRRVRLA